MPPPDGTTNTSDAGLLYELPLPATRVNAISESSGENDG